MLARAALSTGRIGMGSLMRLHLSWETPDTLAFSCLNLWSTQLAPRLWGLWRPLHHVCWRSVRQTGTDFHIYDHTVSPWSLTLIATYVNKSYSSEISYQFPDIIMWIAAKDHQKIEFNLFGFFLFCFGGSSPCFFSDKIWTDGDAFYGPKTKNPISNQPVYIQLDHTYSVREHSVRLMAMIWVSTVSSACVSGPGFFLACNPIFIHQDLLLLRRKKTKIKQI